MGEHGLVAADFINRSVPSLSVEGLERPLLMAVGGFVAGEPQDDELHPGKMKQEISFSLPPGSYATIVLKYLLAPHD